MKKIFCANVPPLSTTSLWCSPLILTYPKLCSSCLNLSHSLLVYRLVWSTRVSSCWLGKVYKCSPRLTSIFSTASQVSTTHCTLLLQIYFYNYLLLQYYPNFSNIPKKRHLYFLMVFYAIRFVIIFLQFIMLMISLTSLQIFCKLLCSSSIY